MNCIKYFVRKPIKLLKTKTRCSRWNHRKIDWASWHLKWRKSQWKAAKFIFLFGIESNTVENEEYLFAKFVALSYAIKKKWFHLQPLFNFLGYLKNAPCFQKVMSGDNIRPHMEDLMTALETATEAEFQKRIPIMCW